MNDNDNANMYEIFERLNRVQAMPSKIDEAAARAAEKTRLDESAFQAAIGKKKYGEEGMKALQKAGRDHASDKTMKNIRNKYDKYDEAQVNEIGDTARGQNALAAVADRAQQRNGGELTGMYKAAYPKADQKSVDLMNKSKGTTATPHQAYKSAVDRMSPRMQRYGQTTLPVGASEPGAAHSSDQEGMLSRAGKAIKGVLGMKEEGGTPMTPKQKSFAKLAPPADKITFADKIAGAKQEVDEMLGDVAADAIKKAVNTHKGGQVSKGKGITKHAAGAGVYGGSAPDKGHIVDRMKGPSDTALRGKRKQETEEGNAFSGAVAKAKATGADEFKVGSKEYKVKENFPTVADAEKRLRDKEGKTTKGTVTKTATGLRHTRDYEHDVEADDEKSSSGEKRKAGRPKKYSDDAPRQERVTAKSRKTDRTAHGQAGFKKDKVKENNVDMADQGEYDQEGDMAKDQLHTLMQAAESLSSMLQDNDNLPEWVQSKITKAVDYINASRDYMDQEAHDMDENPMDEAVRGTVFGKQGYRAPQTQGERDTVAQTIKQNRTQNRADTRVSGYGSRIAPQRGVSSADTGGARGSAVNVDQSGQATDFNPGTGNIDPRAQGYRGSLNLGKGSQGKGVVGEEDLDEKAVSKKQQRFMGMAHAMQKGEKISGAGKELKKVAKTMKKGDVEDFAKTKHKGLPEKAKKKKEESVEETTTSGSVAAAPSTGNSKGGMSFGKGIYDSVDRKVEAIIAESMSINMSTSTEGGQTITVTASDDDAMKLAALLKMAGIGSGDTDGGCDSCGESPCDCDHVDENAPDWPTNKEYNGDALQYAGGLNKPKETGQTTAPVFSRDARRQHTPESEELTRIREIAGLKEAAKPDFLDMDKDGDKEEPMKKAVKDKEEEKKVEESIFALTNQWRAYKG